MIATRFLLVMAAAIMFAGAAAAQAPAQPGTESDAGPDAQQVVLPPQPGAATAPQPKQFRIMLTVPLLATSNAVGAAATDVASPTNKPDVHINPDLLLKWTGQFQFLRLTAAVDLSLDRYAINTDQNTDTVYGAFKAALTDGHSDWFVPYVAALPTVDYQPFFAHRDDALLSLALGFTSGFGIDAHGKVVPFRDATDPGDWSVLLDVSGGRRLADPKDFRNRFVFASIEIDYNVNRNLLIGLPRA